MTNFVLVRGYYQGGWNRQPVAGPLREAGYTVCLSTLDGCVEWRHQFHPGIDATLHASGIIELLF